MNTLVGQASACGGLQSVPRACYTLVATLLASHCFAQQAILPRKGRQPDRTAPTPVEPIRRLPRPGTARPEPIAAPLVSFGPHVPDQPQAEDRLRQLVQGTVTPFEPIDQPWIRFLPQVPVMVA